MNRNRKRAEARKKRTRSRVRRVNARRNDQKNRKARIGITCMVVFLILILSAQIVQLNAKNKASQAQMTQLEKQLKSEQSRTSKLQEKQKYTNSDAYIEGEAKSKLGMAYDDEIVFKEK